MVTVHIRRSACYLKEGVTMLIGEYNHSVDTKGRVIIPSKFREDLGDTFVVTKGLDGCLSIYPEAGWKDFQERMATLPLTNRDSRNFKRFFLGSAVECELDKQGRALISAALRSYAGLTREVVLVGLQDRIEIWDKAKWDANNADTCENMEDIAEHMEDLGLSI